MDVNWTVTLTQYSAWDDQDGVVSAVIKLLAGHLMSNHGSIPSRGRGFVCCRRYSDLSGDHPTSYSLSSVVSFVAGKVARAWMWLVLRVRMTELYFWWPYTFPVCWRTAFPSPCFETNYFSILYFSQEQATLKAKQRMLREDWELFKAQRKLLQQKMWNKTARYCMICVCVCVCHCLMLQCYAYITDCLNSFCQWYIHTSGNLLDFGSTSTIEYGM